MTYFDAQTEIRRENEEAKALVDSMVSESPDVMSTITADLSAGMGHGKDAIIVQVILDTGEVGFTMASTEAIRKRGRFEIYPDKTEIFLWDNVPLLKFYPMEVNMENGKITASQPYQVLSR